MVGHFYRVLKLSIVNVDIPVHNKPIQSAAKPSERPSISVHLPAKQRRAPTSSTVSQSQGVSTTFRKRYIHRRGQDDSRASTLLPDADRRFRIVHLFT